jgi:hypothetical protein
VNNNKDLFLIKINFFKKEFTKIKNNNNMIFIIIVANKPKILQFYNQLINPENFIPWKEIKVLVIIFQKPKL